MKEKKRGKEQGEEKEGWEPKGKKRRGKERGKGK